MKSSETLRLLGVTRVTLMSYVKKGLIKAKKKKNGYYDYDEESVFNFLNKSKRKNVIYARVSTYKQKKDLQRQIDCINKYCVKKEITISNTYSEVHSGIDMERPEFTKLLNSILKYEVDSIFISNKDRLTRLSFITLQSIFEKFGTKIVIVGRKESTDEKDLFEELISIMHYFSTKMYSNRRKRKIELIKEDIQLETEK